MKRAAQYVWCLAMIIGCAPAKDTTPTTRHTGAVPHGLVGLEPAEKPPEWVLDGWDQVDDIGGLAQHVDQAAEKGTPMIVSITAKWCADCQVLEKDVLANDAVAKQLGSVRRVLIDVTTVSDESQQLLAIFGIQGLPAILYYTDAVPLAGFLLAPQKVQRPKATLIILEPVDADEFLRRLQKSP